MTPSHCAPSVKFGYLYTTQLEVYRRQRMRKDGSFDFWYPCSSSLSLLIPNIPPKLKTDFPLFILYVKIDAFSSVQSLNHVRLFVTPWTAARQASLSITNSRSLLKLIHWVSDAIQPSHPLSSPSPPAFYLSQHQDHFHESALHIR